MYTIKLTDLNLPLTPFEFVRLFLPSVRKFCVENDFDVANTLAHMALESGWNRQSMHFNFFGMKWNKKVSAFYYTSVTTEYLTPKQLTKEFVERFNPSRTGKNINGKEEYIIRDKFCAFADIEDGLNGYKAMLELSFPKSYEARNTYAFFLHLKSEGYATAPDYVHILEGLRDYFNSSIHAI